jgi:site-specific recombinase XerD
VTQLALFNRSDYPQKSNHSLQIKDHSVMATIYRPVTIRYLDKDGKQVLKNTPGACQKRVRSKTWRARYRDSVGKHKTASLRTEDRQEAQERLAELLQKLKQRESDPFAEHRETLLSKHLDDFKAHLIAKANTDRYARLTTNRVQRVLDGCRFKLLTELKTGPVNSWLHEQRKGTMGPATSNHYVTALKTFGNWLLRDRRCSENPFAFLSRVNAKVDVRCVRRILTRDELSRLVQAAHDGKYFRELSGPDRAILYLLAAFTGLRVSELASLTNRSLNLQSDPPTVTVEAACSKHRREDVLPLHSALAVRLREWLDNRKRTSINHGTNPVADSQPFLLFPGTWTERAAPMIRRDLKAARESWVSEAETTEERDGREESEFLLAKTSEGRADFHALRHTFISNLAGSGVHPKLAKELARHSTITLTMDRYSHVGLLDMNTALETVPGIPFTATFTNKLSTDSISVAPQVATETVQLTDYQESSRKTAAAGDDSNDSRNVSSQEELSEELTSPEKWWGGELNPRPAGYESAALTN